MNIFCRITTLAVVAVMAAGCSSPDPAEQERMAREAAVKTVSEAYSHLLVGDYDHFIALRAGTDSLPRAYRSQMATAYKQFMAQQQADRGGLRSFEMMGAQRDSALGVMQVFLLLRYGDHTTEEVVVPVIEQAKGQWRMK